MTTHDHTAALLADILNPDRSAIDICTTHDLSFADLADFLAGPLYQSLADATRALARARTELLILDIEPRALLALSITTDTDDQSRPVHETIRKSATKLLTIARQKTAGSSTPGGPARRAGSPPASPAPAGEMPSPRGGGGLPSDQPTARNPASAATLASRAPAGEAPSPRGGGRLPSNQPKAPTSPPPTHAPAPLTPRNLNTYASTTTPLTRVPRSQTTSEAHNRAPPAAA